MEYSIPKGVFDILPIEGGSSSDWKMSDKWQYVESIIKECCFSFGFQEIRTPIFEKTDLFVRSSGETSDIVSKEMYTFEDKGGRSMTLRPEGTAPVMRSVLENNLVQKLCPLKLFYLGPIFRYDRPQAGRYRQHHQFGVEAIGCDKPEQDAEVIALLYEIYGKLGIKNLEVQINSIGDLESRKLYNQALKKHLSNEFSKLSKDSQLRLEKNPLRILDSKAPEDHAVLKNAPSILDFLDDESKTHFQKVLYCLEKLNIKTVTNAHLVRGLDYYNRTVFEFVSEDLGAQSTIGAGGRYDDLAKFLGKKSLPAVGFASGIERVLQTMLQQGCAFPEPSSCFLYILPLSQACLDYGLILASKTRKAGIATELDLTAKKIQQGLQKASKVNAHYCLVLGEDELSSGKAVLKNLKTREQTSIELSECVKATLLLKAKA